MIPNDQDQSTLDIKLAHFKQTVAFQLYMYMQIYLVNYANLFSKFKTLLL